MSLYYTLQPSFFGEDKGTTFSLFKWDSDYKRPLEKYIQTIRGDGVGNSWRVSYCNCPSRSNPCKHATISLDLLRGGLENLHYYAHDGFSVFEAKDV